MSPETVQLPTAEQIRNRVHHMWGSVAESWGEHVDHVEQRAEAVTRLMIDAVAPAPGEEVLELACGAGGLGLAIAEKVTPGGRVVLSDVAPEMVAIASTRAACHDQVGGAVTQVSAQVIDLEQIDMPDASFDIVVCRDEQPQSISEQDLENWAVSGIVPNVTQLKEGLPVTSDPLPVTSQDRTEDADGLRRL